MERRMEIEIVPADLEENPEVKKRFYNIDEAAAYLGLSRSSIWRLRERKEIGFHKFGSSIRFTPKQLEEYVNKNIISTKV
jgi:excisionase family DNA binding protein